jgi:UPF0755 protein
MSRDEFEYTDDRPARRDSGRFDHPDGRRRSRADRPDEQWLADSSGDRAPGAEPDSDLRPGQHRRGQSGPYQDPGTAYPAAPGYGQAAAYPAEPGYGQDALYGQGGYGQGDQAGYGDRPGYGQTAGYGQDAGYGQAAGYGDRAGYGQDPLYGHDAGYGQDARRGEQPGYGSADYNSDQFGRPAYGEPDGYGASPGYTLGDRYGASGDGTYGTRPADSGRQGGGGGYADTGWHTNPGLGADPGRPADPGAQRGFDYRSQGEFADQSFGRVPPEPDGPPTDAAGSYGEPGRLNGQGQYGDPAGYHSAGTPGADAYGRDGYGDQAGFNDGGGYDEQVYRPGPLSAGRGQDRGYGQHGDAADRGYGWQERVDDQGVTPGSRAGEQPAGLPEMDADDARHNGFFSGFGRDDNVSPPPRRRRRGRGRLVALLSVVVLLGVVGFGGYYAYNKYSKAHGDYTGQGTGSVTFQVKAGQYPDELGPELVAAGVIKSASPFDTAATKSGKTSLLQPGYFQLHKQMSGAAAWAMLINPKSRLQSTVGVPDGYRVSKILPILAAKSRIPLANFETAIKDTSALGLPAWAHGNPEGFLYPATYDFPPGATALQILQTIVKQFNTEIASANLSAEARKAHYSEYQVIIAASLLEAEVPPQYYGKVAEVIDNRLNAVPEMTLGFDSTVAYALNKYVYNLTQSDLDVNSPYNTTKHAGLPPGPIDSPDLAAINAVLHPQKGDWLYFVTVNKAGLTKFTASSSQIQIYDNEAQRNGLG